MKLSLYLSTLLWCVSISSHNLYLRGVSLTPLPLYTHRNGRWLAPEKVWTGDVEISPDLPGSNPVPVSLAH